MRIVGTFMLASIFTLTGMQSTLPAAEKKDDGKTPPEAVAKWRQLKFGLFIHWGPVSLKGTEIGWSRGRDDLSRGEKVPIEEYDNLYKQFNPVKFNADEWVEIAKDAGMKYLVLNTKHHDGFCLFDTKQTDYNIMHSPFSRDVVKELAEACRKQGILFGAYYSICDWHHPHYPHGSPGGRTLHPNADMDRYVQFMKDQLKELLTNYGPVGILWFDGEWEKAWTHQRGKDLYAYLHGLQPDLIINDRVGKNRQAMGMSGVSKGDDIVGDFDTPEQEIGKMQTDRPWETCMTICQQWAWKPNDKLKSLKECLHILVNTVGGDGNLLLNVGPMPDGRIEPRQAERLREMGQWLAKYGESIYGTRGGPFPRGNWGAATYKDNTIYLHVLAPNLAVVKLPPINKKIVGSSVLTGGSATVNQTEAGIEVSVPKSDRQEIDTIVVLKLDGPAADAMR
ncbi:MAG: alpha-L-fucosidase [Planctomycetes bacterium]|nr:alpha-L-fucosidase [Planctomycetota bacterium]